MTLNITADIVSKIIENDDFKHWLRSRRWFGEKSLQKFNVKLESCYIIPHNSLEEIPSVEYAIVITVISISDDDEANYFLPLCIVKSHESIEGQIDSFNLIQERMVKIDLGGGSSSYSIFEAEFLSNFWNLVFTESKEFTESSDINYQPIIDFCKNIPKKSLKFNIQELGGSDTTNIVLKLEISQIDSVIEPNEYSSIVIKSYRKFVPHIEIEMLITLNQNYFTAAPKILGTLNFQHLSVISILSFRENQGDLGLIYWNDLNSLFDYYLENLDQLRGLNSEKMNHQWEFKFKEYCDNSLRTSQEIGTFLKQMHECLINEESNEFKLESITPETESFLFTQFKSLIADIIGSVDFLKETGVINNENVIESLVGISSRFDKKDYFLKLKDVKVQRIHQDLHMSQILLSTSPDSQFIVLDFEGDPQLSIDDQKRKYPIEKDLASLLRSLDYIKLFSLIDGIKQHYREPSDQIAQNLLLSFYLNRKPENISDDDFIILKNLIKIGERWQTKISELITISYYKYEELLNMKMFLIDLFTIERCLSELNYEIRFRPENVIVPYLGLKRMFSKDFLID